MTEAMSHAPSVAVLACAVALAGVARAQVAHPVYPLEPDASKLNSAVSATDLCMSMSEDELRELITEKAGFTEIKCPNCTAGHQGFQLAWEPTKPDQVHCKYCGHVYPSDDYPMDKLYEHEAPTGEVQQYPYHEGPDGFRHYFQAKVDQEARQWAIRMAYQCAQAYAYGGDQTYAHRAAVILHRLAEVYPHIPIHGLSDYSFRGPKFHPNDPPYPYLSGKLTSTWFYSEIQEGLLRAYDLIYNSGELERLSAEIGRDAGQMIEDDLLAAMAEYTLNLDRRWLTNMTPSWCRKLFVAGRVLGRPNYVHEAANMLRDLLAQDFLADGMWKEGTVSYHVQTANGLRSAWSVAAGHSDPPGYTYPETGERFDELDPFTAETFLQKALLAHQAIAYPDGSFCCVNDTWPAHRTQPSETETCELLWAMGHAVLGSGSGAARTQAQLAFSGCHGHCHADPLNLTFWATGRELVSDMGYTHTIYRRYASSSAAHNLVVVDETQASAGSRSLAWAGEMRLWEPRGSLAKAVSVNMPDAYEATSKYQRTIVLINRPEGPGYLVDFFEVEGGSRHDWLLRGSADHDQTISSPAAMERLGYSLLGPDRTMVPYVNEGGQVTVPVGATNVNQKPREGEQTQYNVYGLIRDLQRLSTDADFTATFEYLGAGPKMSVQILGAPGSDCYLGTAPSIKRSNRNSDTVDEVRHPILVVRRAGDEPLTSRFSAVLWPHQEGAELPQVTPLTSAGEQVGLEVRFEQYRDLVIAPRQPPEAALTIEENGVQTDAMLAVARVSGDEVVAAQATGGTLFRVGTWEMKTAPDVTGTILAASGGANGGSTRLAVEADIPTSAPLTDAPVLVTHADGAFSLMTVKQVHHEDGKTLLEVEEPPDFSVEAGKTTFRYYPRREIEGVPRFTVQSLCSWTQR